MASRPLYSRAAVIVILVLQIIPLLLFPTRIYGSGSQQLWLPALLAIMVVAADVRLIFGRSSFSLAPWYLLAFAQGFNVISRLMLVWPNGSTVSSGVVTQNWDYVILSVVAIALSTWLLVYLEKPEVRRIFLPA